jgi:hypothetical protein
MYRENRTHEVIRTPELDESNGPDLVSLLDMLFVLPLRFDHPIDTIPLRPRAPDMYYLRLRQYLACELLIEQDSLCHTFECRLHREKHREFRASRRNRIELLDERHHPIPKKAYTLKTYVVFHLLRSRIVDRKDPSRRCRILRIRKFAAFVKV